MFSVVPKDFPISRQRRRSVCGTLMACLQVLISMKLLQYLTFLLLLISASAPAKDPLAGLADWVDAERERWGIPGLAVAIVQGDEVLLAQGFGYLDLDRSRPVDADTQFGIASLSKAMTATALGILVDEGLLNWDDRVVDHLPGFSLSDPWVSAQVTIRDLLSHRVGVGRLFGNRLTFMPAASRGQALAVLRHHEFEQPFRQGYVYSNAMYAAAGAVLEAISGQAWEDFVEQRLFAPMAMTRSNTRLSALDDNAARPHQEIRGELVEIDRRDWTWGAPAAAVNSTVSDLARWMLFNLNGELEGKELVSEDVLKAIHAPSNLTGFDPDYHGVSAYGLGWGLGRYQTFHVLRHGGATDGINSLVWLLPELELGIVVSANRFTGFNTALAREVVDRFAGLDSTDWSGQLLEDNREARADAAADREDVDRERQAETAMSRPLADLLGEYFHPLYGSAEVILDNGEPALRLWQDDSQRLVLKHWHHDTFKARWINPAQREKFVWFAMGEDGLPAELNVRFTLRPLALEEGVYPANYVRIVRYLRQ
ncbi:MAG: serine hydrolase [Wenzhouxiangella sp.]|nr:MAG: serine hydrolase [Wenzhouxiangella sp.]